MPPAQLPIATTTATATKQEPPQVDAWIVQKLKNEWSSSEFGGLLSKDKLSDAVTSFRHLDTAIKVRFLLSFLSMRRDVVDESKFAIVEIIDAAENDAEEWVRVGAGIVKQYMFMADDDAESGDSFFHDQIATTSARVLDAVLAPSTLSTPIDDAFSHESAFLNASVRPHASASSLPSTQQHFTVVEPASASSAAKPVAHRLPLPRSATGSSASVSSASTVSTSSSVAANASTRLTPSLANKSAHLPPRKHVTELSEIRRKADAGRFKRQRSRISMIDLDEVKQIETEKAIRAEERKKQKVAAAAAAKDKDKDKSSNASGTHDKASSDKTSDKTTGNSVAGNADAVAVTTGGHDDVDASLSVLQSTDDDDDDDGAHDDDEDEDDEDGSHDHVGAHGRHDYAQQQHMSSSSLDDNDRNDFGGDGTQALLNAAIMTEVGSLNHQYPPNQHQYQPSHPQQQQQQQQHVYHHFEHDASAPQPPPPLATTTHYHHRGFEPEDASAAHLHAFSGFNGFGAAWSDATSYVQPQPPIQPTQQYQSLPQLQQFGGVGVGLNLNLGLGGLTGIGGSGFLDDQPMQLPPHGTSSRQQQTTGTTANSFDSSGHTGTSNYLDGPPDYWR